MTIDRYVCLCTVAVRPPPGRFINTSSGLEQRRENRTISLSLSPSLVCVLLPPPDSPEPDHQRGGRGAAEGKKGREGREAWWCLRTLLPFRLSDRIRVFPDRSVSCFVSPIWERESGVLVGVPG